MIYFFLKDFPFPFVWRMIYSPISFCSFFSLIKHSSFIKKRQKYWMEALNSLF